jgi:oxygen-dependent protoporphyrinogen oxidase
MEPVDVAVIGAGVSGLSAAYELHKRHRSVVVLDRSARPGGVVRTDHLGAFVVDAGPDAILAQKPAGIALCKELGLGDRLFSTKLPRTAFVLRGGRLHPLPEASVLGFPTRLTPLVKSTLFSAAAKARMAAEPVVPRRGSSQDESIAAFVRRRFGSEAVTYIAEPLLAGIHAGDVERLSMSMLFPKLMEAEQQAGSVVRAFRRERRPVTTDGVFRSFPNGLGELINALMKAVPEDSVRLDSPVTRIARGDGFVIEIDGRPPIRARAIILAIPAFAAAELVQTIDADLARACRTIRYLSTATVVFAFPRSAIGHDLLGTGFVVPRVEGLAITAAAWISSKWPDRAPEGQALLRAFLGGAREPEILTKSDGSLIDLAFADLRHILHIDDTPPTMTQVYRWDRSSPQQEVGHVDLMRRIDERLATHPGLFISSAGFRGVGIPDCVADARQTAAGADSFVGR